MKLAGLNYLRQRAAFREYVRGTYTSTVLPDAWSDGWVARNLQHGLRKAPRIETT